MTSYSRSFASLIFFVLALLCPTVGQAQQEDMNVWTRLAVKYDISTKTRLAVEEEFRFHENASKMKQSHTEIGLSHELAPRWSGGAYYRFTYEPSNSRGYSLGHRAWLQLEYLLLDTDLEISIRTRLQTSNEDYFSSEYGKVPEWYNRNKIGFAYKPKKAVWIPNGGLEFWYTMDSGSPRYIDKYRINIGLEYRYSKNLRIEVFYNYQQQIQVNSPGTDHIFGLNCTYLIK